MTAAVKCSKTNVTTVTNNHRLQILKYITEANFSIFKFLTWFHEKFKKSQSEWREVLGQRFPCTLNGKSIFQEETVCTRWYKLWYVFWYRKNSEKKLLRLQGMLGKRFRDAPKGKSIFLGKFHGTNSKTVGTNYCKGKKWKNVKG